MKLNTSVSLVVLHDATTPVATLQTALVEAGYKSLTFKPYQDLDDTWVVTDHPDVFLFAISTPDDSGFEALRASLTRYPDIPVVVLVPENIDPLVLSKTFQMGGLDYLSWEQEPPAVFQHVIQAAIERQRAIRADKTSIRTLVEHTADGILVVDDSGYVQFANPAAGRLFRCSPSELIGVSFGHPVVVGENTELCILQGNGQPITVEMRVVNVEWKGMSCCLASLRDITARRRVEEERDQFFQLSLDMLCVATLDGYFKRVNPAFNSILGYTTKELLEMPFIEFVHPDDRQKTQAEMDKLSAGYSSLYFENRYRCKDGSYRWLSWTASPPTQDGLLFAVARDVTEQKAIEHALREQAQIIEQIQDGVVSTDLDGIVISWNAGAERLFGYSASEALGQHIAFIYPEADREFFDREVFASLKECGSHRVEVRMRRKSGEVFDAFLSLFSLCDRNGEPIGIVGYSKDITERKQAEAALRKSEQLYRTLASNLPKTAAILFDHDLRFLMAEGPALVEQGFRKELIEGKTLWEVLPQQSINRLTPYYRAALAGQENVFESEFGEQTYYVHILPVRNEQGEIYAGLIVSQDITETKLAAKAEAEAEARAARTRQQQMELRSLAHFPHTHRPAADSRLNTALLHRTMPQVFDWLIQSYGQVLDRVLEQRAYKVEHDVSEELRAIADQLGQANAGPRDVIEIHLRTLKIKTDALNPAKNQAYADEGRLIVLELMGYLAGYYRSQLQDNLLPPDTTSS